MTSVRLPSFGSPFSSELMSCVKVDGRGGRLLSFFHCALRPQPKPQGLLGMGGGRSGLPLPNSVSVDVKQH